MNAFKQAVVGTYTTSDTVIELNSISDTVGNADYLPNGGFNLILYDGLFGNPADANNAGKYEILECSSVNYATNEITVVRARENTTAVTIDASSWQVVYGATVEFFDQFEDADATILKQADVVDNLTSTSTTDPLSANQGKQLEDTKIATSAIVNDLTTGGTDVPLSAEQGVVLKGQIDDFSLANLVWNSSADVYSSHSGITSIHNKMKRVVLNSDGTVNYVLNPDNSAQKADGTASVITGADGNVMVQIPKFYVKYSKIGDLFSWTLSEIPRTGFEIHPAFIKDDVEVDHRYIGAYDACFNDVSASDFKSGLNLDNASSLIDFDADKLASVSGQYPLVGVTRGDSLDSGGFRKLASNVGSGWHQLDFYLYSAVQLLFLVEYGNFNSQQVLGDGNTGSSFVSSSSNQTDSPLSIAGKSNSLGNQSTDPTTGASSATRDTAFMSYRGIENWFGNCWNWVDGMISVNRAISATNNYTLFSDSVFTGWDSLGTVPSSNDFVRNILDNEYAFLPSSVSGATSTTFIGDFFFQNTGTRVARVGGYADFGHLAGAFCWRVDNAPSARNRGAGARLCF